MAEKGATPNQDAQDASILASIAPFLQVFLHRTMRLASLQIQHSLQLRHL
jgi:hypothetical protein